MANEEGSFLPTAEIWEAYEKETGTKESKQTLERIMASLFRDRVKNKHLRIQGRKVGWHGYANLIIKQMSKCPASQSTLLTCVIKNVRIPQEAFIMTFTDSKLEFGIRTSVFVNSNMVLKLVSISDDGSVIVSLGNHVIPNGIVGLASKISQHPAVISNLLHSVIHMNTCNGIDVKTTFGHKSAQHPIELISHADGTQMRSTRSKKCLRLLPVTNKNNLCKHCADTMQKNKYVKKRPRVVPDDPIQEENDEKEEEPPKNPDSLLLWLCKNAGVSEEMTLFLQQQIGNYCKTDPRQRRWHERQV